MKTQFNENTSRGRAGDRRKGSSRWFAGVMLSIGTVLVGNPADPLLTAGKSFAKASGTDFCQQTSEHALRSCLTGAKSDYELALGNCENFADPAARKTCQQEAAAVLKDAEQTCQAQFEARQALCERLGGAPYDPVIDPANFGGPIDNPYFSLPPGRTLVYKAETTDGLKKNVVAATHNTRVILGVTCVEVHDVVYINGEVVEDTLDWFAQDKEGNVWYFGENTLEVEGGLIVSTEGSFMAGVDSAKPGIIMKAHPALGDLYRQEFVLGQGEDTEEVIGLDESVTIRFGTFDHCVRIKETTALEPDTTVNDFYAPGIGPVLDIEGPPEERLELVQIITE